MHHPLLAIWFLLPAGIANMVPVLVAHAPILQAWEAPLDAGRSYRGRRILGDHKTWRGIIAGTAAATLVVYLQHRYPIVSYPSVSPLVLGPLLGLGALGGDAVASFAKRQKGIASGDAWIPWDQLDYIIGAIILSLLVIRFDPWVYLWMLIIWCGLHFAVSYLGYRLGLKPRPV